MCSSFLTTNILCCYVPVSGMNMTNPMNDESIWDSGEDESVLDAEVPIDRTTVVEALNAPTDEKNEWSHMNPAMSYDEKQNVPKHATRSGLYKLNENKNTSGVPFTNDNNRRGNLFLYAEKCYLKWNV
ncbi:unnamed protein product [Schistosoma turkestanicum]|nr:unnamed protein product [Schistosoma turkestanicum]